MFRGELHGGSSSPPSRRHTTCRHGTVKRPLVAEPSKKADWPGQGQVVFELPSEGMIFFVGDWGGWASRF